VVIHGAYVFTPETVNTTRLSEVSFHETLVNVNLELKEFKQLNESPSMLFRQDYVIAENGHLTD
jgi:hypothetical protein